MKDCMFPGRHPGWRLAFILIRRSCFLTRTVVASCSMLIDARNLVEILDTKILLRGNLIRECDFNTSFLMSNDRTRTVNNCMCTCQDS